VTDTEQQHEARAAAAHIAAADPVFGDVVKTSELVNPYIWPGVPIRDGDLLAGLVLHIISQQITTVVALSMFDKLNTLLGGAITSRALAASTIEQLRTIGVSGAKARALNELGERLIQDGQLLESLHQLDDTEAQATLVSLRGIGPWSAQMFLLHELKRPDVFPAGDIGLRTAVARLDGLDNTPAVTRAVDRAMIWSPYRSYAAAYLWRWSR
jgi:DNA-3-methyladenine glycosylase II